MGADAAVANLQREQCCIDGQPAQKIQRICFGANCCACNAWDTKQQLCVAASCSDVGHCCVAESCVDAGAAAAEYRLSDAVSAHVAPRNGGVSVSGANGVHEASETLSSSFA